MTYQQYEPDWFDLKNYGGLKTDRDYIFELKLWYRQLCIRRYVLDGLQGQPEWNDVDRQHRRENAIDWLELIKDKPIFDEGFDNFLIGFQSGYGFSALPAPRHPFDQTTVTSTKAEAFYWNWTELKEKATLTLKQNLNLTDKGSVKSSDGRNVFSIDYYLDNIAMNGHLRALGRDMRGQFTYVTVDLTATDGQIMADFEQWLKAYRKATGYMPDEKLRGEATTKKSPTFNEPEIKSWRELNLLPYIDLWLVALAEGRDIDDNDTKEEIAKRLDPENAKRLEHKRNGNYDLAQRQLLNGMTDKIRQTKAPKAKALLSDEILMAIHRQLK